MVNLGRRRSQRRVPLLALLSANAVSFSGSALSGVAIPWFVLETTDSAARLGLVVGLGALTGVVANFFGGPVTDRLGFKLLSVASDLARGVTVALVPLLYLLGLLTFWQLLLLVCLGAVLEGPGFAARMGLIPELADRASMPRERANSASQAIGNVSGLVGPPVAGVLIVAIGTSNVLWVDAASFALSAALVGWAIPSPSRVASPSTEVQPEGATESSYLADLAEGLRFLRSDRVIFGVTAPTVAFNFFLAPVFSVVLVVYAREVFGNATSLGLMFGTLGAGALAGSVIYGTFGHRIPRRVTLIASVTAMVLPVWILATSPSLLTSLGALAIAGFGGAPANPLLFTLVQERTPTRLLGRVMGILFAWDGAAFPLGAALAGYLLDVTSLSLVLVASASGSLLVALSLILNPALRQMDATREP